MQRLLIVAIALASLAAPLSAQEYQGADAVLRKMSQASGQIKPKKAFETAIAEYQSKATRMSPSEAASAWIHLTELYPSYRSPDHFGNQDFYKVFDALPAPETWPLISSKLHRTTRPPSDYASTLRILFDVLTDQPTLLRQDIAATRPSATNLAAFSSLISVFKDPELTTLVLHRIESYDKPETTDEQADMALTFTRFQGDENQIVLPDLVPILGKAQATGEIGRLLYGSRFALQFPEGSASQTIARDIATAHPEKLKTAQWGLAMTLHSGPLYAALARRFPDGQALPKNGARSWYVYGLLSNGQFDQAVRVAGQSSLNPFMVGPYGMIYISPEDYPWVPQVLSDKGGNDSLWRFWFSRIGKTSEYDEEGEWLIALSVKLGRLDDLIQRMGAELQTKNLDDHTRQRLNSLLAKACLADNEVDQALPHLKAAAKGDQSDADLLVRLGLLYHNPEAVAEGLPELTLRHGNVWLNPQEKTIAMLQKYGHGADAERVLETELVDSTKGDSLAYPGSEALMELCGIYWKANRPDDVLTLLNDAPNWEAADITDTNSNYQGANPAFMAAWALNKTGRDQLAMTILDFALRQDPSFDAAYELLPNLLGLAAFNELDALQPLNPLEMRPLIWRAKVSAEIGGLETAEKYARDAIAIDPSDGQQLYGGRFYAYTVLADILDAEKKNPEESARLRRAVKAIRIGEEADALEEACVPWAAIAKYREALAVYADAYCLHSRLGNVLEMVGKTQEAADEYRRAAELMPGQIGREEPSCFETQTVFQTKVCQSAAEPVLTKLEQSEPQNAQVHFLMGVLRDQQNRRPEAVAEYRKAVEIEPNYLTAWTHLSNEGDEAVVSRSDLAAIQEKLLELTPTGPTWSDQWATGLDPKNFPLAYTMEAKALQKARSPQAKLYPLRASAQELAKTQNDEDNSSVTITTPAGVVRQSQAVSFLISLLEGQAAQSTNR